MIYSIAIIIVCVLLVIVVLIQNSKGGGIQSQFGVANQIMGVKRGADVIEKTTWVLAILLLALSLLMAPKIGGTSAGEEIKSRTKDKAAGAVMPTAPAAPANNAAPQGGGVTPSAPTPTP
jgi:preprotein translocase subunit SecG